MRMEAKTRSGRLRLHPLLSFPSIVAMAATASDIRDALSLGPAAPRKPSAASRAGISRELYSLIGDSAPPLVVRAPRFKARPDLGRPKARWALNAFSHPARSDGLQLKHWERTTPNKKTKQPQPPDEYRFAKFSQPCTVYEYTDEEYAEYLEGLCRLYS